MQSHIGSSVRQTAGEFLIECAKKYMGCGETCQAVESAHAPLPLFFELQLRGAFPGLQQQEIRHKTVKFIDLI
jgi:hypothetical protein